MMMTIFERGGGGEAMAGDCERDNFVCVINALGFCQNDKARHEGRLPRCSIDVDLLIQGIIKFQLLSRSPFRKQLEAIN